MCYDTKINCSSKAYPVILQTVHQTIYSTLDGIRWRKQVMVQETVSPKNGNVLHLILKLFKNFSRFIWEKKYYILLIRINQILQLMFVWHKKVANRRRKKVVAAIDFDSTYSGYAFFVKRRFPTNPSIIHKNSSWSSF